MKVYWLSLAAGLVVGVVYALMQVRSPAPPVVALLGLLGILLGEQAVPLAKRAIRGEAVTSAWFLQQIVPTITGVPVRTAAAPDKEHP